MSFENVVAVLRVVERDAHETFLTGWGHQNRRVLAIRVQSAEAFGVIAGIDGINEAKIREVVHIHSIFKDHNNSV